MSTLDSILSSINVAICIFGFLLCLYILMNNNLNDKTGTNIVSLCLVGFGWFIFLYASIDLFEVPHAFFIAGRLCFLLGIFVWFYNNVLQFQINKLKEE